MPRRLSDEAKKAALSKATGGDAPGGPEEGEGPATDVDAREADALRKELLHSEAWRSLRKELADDEVRFFQHKYVKLMGQFKNNILPTEEIQIFDSIKLEVLKHRNMVERKKAQDEIKEVEGLQKAAWARLAAEERTFFRKNEQAVMVSLEGRLESARDRDKTSAAEYLKLQERHDALMKSLKATREQRIKEVESGKESIIGLFKMLQDRDAQEREGRTMELLRLAGERARVSLGGPHEFTDGVVDQPILSADTVGPGVLPDREGLPG